MTLDRKLRDLDRFYRQIELRARKSLVNRPPSGLALRLDDESKLSFLPAGSIALQALVPRRVQLHHHLIGMQRTILNDVPQLERRVFWQPPGTFHLNVGIFRRLSTTPLLPQEKESLLRRACECLVAVEDSAKYKVRFKGLSVTEDGTIIMRGYPEDETPWRLRESLIAMGFCDQQSMFHITVGRVVTTTASDTWRRLVCLVYDKLDQSFGDWVVRKVILVDEREGYLQNRRAYDVIRSIKFN